MPSRRRHVRCSGRAKQTSWEPCPAPGLLGASLLAGSYGESDAKCGSAVCDVTKVAWTAPIARRPSVFGVVLDAVIVVAAEEVVVAELVAAKVLD